MEVKPYNERNDEEKKQMWEEIAEVHALPKSQRPSHRELYEKYGIPESTYYWTTSKREFKEKVVEICLTEAKTWVPELLEVLKEKAIVDKSEKSIEMALKYVGEVADRFDHTSKGEKIDGFVLTPEQRKRIAEEELNK